jgi:signal peptide peptidase SppA
VPGALARLLNRPLAIERARAQALVRSYQAAVIQPQAFFSFMMGARELSPQYSVEDRTATVSICGPIMQRDDGLCALFGECSLDQLRLDLETALADPAVDRVLLDVDSPGGTVAGVFDLADWIRAQRGKKPMWAVANEAAYSAAYALAAAADRVVLSRTAGLGSVGVIALHVDYSKMEEGMGITVTPVYAGARKNDYSDDAPLTDTARALLQAEVDRLYGFFIETVAASRSMKTEAVRATEAGCFYGQNAVDVGFADEVASFEEIEGKFSGTPGRAKGAYAVPKEGALVPAIAVHHTATSDSSWDGPANDARCPATEAALRESHAWYAGEKPAEKGSYKFIHHEVGTDGKVGAANLTACSDGIAVLNGARGGANIPDADREGVHAHLAAHLKDAGKEAPALASLTDVAKAKAATTQPAAGAVVLDLDAERKKIRGESRAEALEIVALCKVAALLEFASELLGEEGMTLAIARERIAAKRAAAGSPQIDNKVSDDAAKGGGGAILKLTAVYNRMNGLTNEKKE